MSDNEKLLDEMVKRFKMETIAVADNSKADSDQMKIQTRNSTIAVMISIFAGIGWLLYLVIDSKIEQNSKPILILQSQHTMKIEQHDKDIASNKEEMRALKAEINSMSKGIDYLVSQQKAK
jgi:hypothetical protein